jgi:hypothetical protein
MQVSMERAKRNFEQWYGGVPRLVLEGPARLSDESSDSEAALSAIETTSIEQVMHANVHVMHASVLCGAMGYHAQHPPGCQCLRCPWR